MPTWTATSARCCASWKAEPSARSGSIPKDTVKKPARRRLPLAGFFTSGPNSTALRTKYLRDVQSIFPGIPGFLAEGLNTLLRDKAQRHSHTLRSFRSHRNWKRQSPHALLQRHDLSISEALRMADPVYLLRRRPPPADCLRRPASRHRTLGRDHPAHAAGCNAGRHRAGPRRHPRPALSHCRGHADAAIGPGGRSCSVTRPPCWP